MIANEMELECLFGMILLYFFVSHSVCMCVCCTWIPKCVEMSICVFASPLYHAQSIVTKYTNNDSKIESKIWRPTQIDVYCAYINTRFFSAQFFVWSRMRTSKITRFRIQTRAFISLWIDLYIFTFICLYEQRANFDEGKKKKYVFKNVYINNHTIIFHLKKTDVDRARTRKLCAKVSARMKYRQRYTIMIQKVSQKWENFLFKTTKKNTAPLKIFGHLHEKHSFWFYWATWAYLLTPQFESCYFFKKKKNAALLSSKQENFSGK